ncbi:hypothetical protein KO361_03410 [Candidatus Woesearchaeota archaeon]|nr:hypothetical protein [Candidatus Woesearchaeota archaeon]
MDEQDIKKLKKYLFNLNDFYVLINHEIKDHLNLRRDEFKFRKSIPEINDSLDFYFRGAPHVLSQTSLFLSCMRLQSQIDLIRYGKDSEFKNELFEEKLSSKLEEAQVLTNFYDSFIFHVNEWARIESTQPLMILSNDKVIGDIYKRISSPENLEIVSEKLWGLFETAIELMPNNKLSGDYNLKFNDLIRSHNSLFLGSFVPENIPRVSFSFDNENILEPIGWFKEGYHDKLLEYRVSKYFS